MTFFANNFSELKFPDTITLTMSGGAESLVKGFGDDFIFGTIAVLMIALISSFVIQFFKRRYAEGVLATSSNSPQTIAIHLRRRNPSDICPICLDEFKFAVETNCSHWYCGLCFKTMYDMNSHRAVTCPSCRQRVTLLFLHFTNEEMNAPHSSELGLIRHTVIELFHQYNNTFAVMDRSIMDHLRDLPALLRNLWSEFFTINGMLRFRFRVRIGFYCSIMLFYLCIPFDIIPESIFGLLGFMDDLLISFVFFIYLAALYRRHILDRH